MASALRAYLDNPSTLAPGDAEQLSYGVDPSGEFGRGLASHDLTGQAGDLYSQALEQESRGNRGPASALRRSADARLAMSQQYGPSARTLSDAGKTGDYAGYVAGTLGSAAPEIPKYVLGAAAGRLGGSILGRYTGGASALRNIGGFAGAAAPGYEAGRSAEVTRQYTTPGETERLSPETRQHLAMGAGAAGAAFGGGLGAGAVRSALRPLAGSVLGRVAAGGVEGAALNVGQEVARQAIAHQIDPTQPAFDASNLPDVAAQGSILGAGAHGAAFLPTVPFRLAGEVGSLAAGAIRGRARAPASTADVTAAPVAAPTTTLGRGAALAKAAYDRFSPALGQAATTAKSALDTGLDTATAALTGKTDTGETYTGPGTGTAKFLSTAAEKWSPSVARAVAKAWESTKSGAANADTRLGHLADAMQEGDVPAKQAMGILFPRAPAEVSPVTTAPTALAGRPASEIFQRLKSGLSAAGDTVAQGYQALKETLAGAGHTSAEGADAATPEGQATIDTAARLAANAPKFDAILGDLKSAAPEAKASPLDSSVFELLSPDARAHPGIRDNLPAISDAIKAIGAKEQMTTADAATVARTQSLFADPTIAIETLAAKLGVPSEKLKAVLAAPTASRDAANPDSFLAHNLAPEGKGATPSQLAQIGDTVDAAIGETDPTKHLQAIAALSVPFGREDAARAVVQHYTNLLHETLGVATAERAEPKAETPVAGEVKPAPAALPPAPEVTPESANLIEQWARHSVSPHEAVGQYKNMGADERAALRSTVQAQYRQAKQNVADYAGPRQRAAQRELDTAAAMLDKMHAVEHNEKAEVAKVDLPATIEEKRTMRDQALSTLTDMAERELPQGRDAAGRSALEALKADHGTKPAELVNAIGHSLAASGKDTEPFFQWAGRYKAAADAVRAAESKTKAENQGYRDLRSAGISTEPHTAALAQQLAHDPESYRPATAEQAINDAHQLTRLNEQAGTLAVPKAFDGVRETLSAPQTEKTLRDAMHSAPNWATMSEAAKGDADRNLSVALGKEPAFPPDGAPMSYQTQEGFEHGLRMTQDTGAANWQMVRQSVRGSTGPLRASAFQALDKAEAEGNTLSSNYWEQATGEIPKPDEAVQKALRDEITRTNGPDVAVKFFESLAGKGRAGDYRYDPKTGERMIRIALAQNTQMLGTAWHESAHDFFKLMSENAKVGIGRNAYRDAKQTADSPYVKAQLRNLLKDQPKALDAAMESSVNGSHERMAYMYQFMRKGDMEGNPGKYIRLDPPLLKWMQSLRDMFYKAMGVVTRGTKVENVLRAFNDGKFADPKNLEAGLADLKSDTLRDRLEHYTPGIVNAFDAVMSSTTDRLRGFGYDGLDKLADMFHKEPGRQGGENGFVNKRIRAMNQQGHKIEALIRDKSATELNEMWGRFQSMKEDPTNQLDRGVREFLNGFIHDYMTKAGVKLFDPEALGENGEPGAWVPISERFAANFAPRRWDHAQIEAKRDKFVSLIARDAGVSPEQAGAMVSAALSGDGFVGLASNEHHAGYVPYAQSLLARQWNFITKENAADYADFQSKDFVGTMRSYIYQGTSRAEHTRMFGNRGEAIDDALKEAGSQGLRGDQLKSAKHAIGALEGSLGSTFSPALRRLFGNLVAYQNIVLLPLTLLSSMGDVQSIAVRSNNGKEAFKALKAGFGAIGDAIKAKVGGKKLEPSEMEKVMRKLGMIESLDQSENYGSAYNHNFMANSVRNLSAKFFQYNGMDVWNRQMRESSFGAGQRFIRDNVGNARYMQDLGLKPQDMEHIHELPDTDGRMALLPSDFEAIGKPTPPEETLARLHEAMYRFVDSSNLRPNAATLPAWASDPRWMLIAQMKRYNYTFQNTTTKSIANEVGHGNNKAALLAAGFLPFGIMSGGMRRMIAGGSAFKDMSIGQILHDGAMRSGIEGTGNFIDDALRDTSHGSLPGASFLGPTAEHAKRVLEYVTGGPTSTASLLARSSPLSPLVKATGVFED
jgi:hypothetical protein